MTVLIQDLNKCTVEGNVIKLPTEHLADYPGLKKALHQAGAIYKRNAFIFPNEAQPYVDKLLGGTSINRKKETQFFETPDAIAEQMMNQILVQTGPIRVLEPSAG